MLYVYGRFLSKQLVKTIHSDQMLPFFFKFGLIKYHMMICYSLYIAGNLARDISPPSRLPLLNASNNKVPYCGNSCVKKMSICYLN